MAGSITGTFKLAALVGCTVDSIVLRVACHARVSRSFVLRDCSRTKTAAVLRVLHLDVVAYIQLFVIRQKKVRKLATDTPASFCLDGACVPETDHAWVLQRQRLVIYCLPSLMLDASGDSIVLVDFYLLPMSILGFSSVQVS